MYLPIANAHHLTCDAFVVHVAYPWIVFGHPAMPVQHHQETVGSSHAIYYQLIAARNAPTFPPSFEANNVAGANLSNRDNHSRGVISTS